ncbi:MAG: hypothetical protein DMF97_04380 [Acidobacteria bacterium]|nr:MAG: hypothetical protein DMF97_04380 [Acidobacteriota bacterium]
MPRTRQPREFRPCSLSLCFDWLESIAGLARCMCLSKDPRQQLKTWTATEQAARTRENDAAQALTTEQKRWVHLNTRLDELERLLAPVR